MFEIQYNHSRRVELFLRLWLGEKWHKHVGPKILHEHGYNSKTTARRRDKC